MSINKKKAFIHRANDNRTEASDLTKKIRVANLLRKEFGLNALGLVDEFIFARIENDVRIDRSILKDPKMHINRIDLYVKKPNEKIIEIDGLNHGFFDEVTQSKQTKSRNENYNLGGFTEEKKNLIIITTEDLKLDDDSLANLLSVKLGMLRIHGI